MKVVIMAGGRGTRISSVASDIPKPMIKISNKPVLEWEIECLREQGLTDIIITVGHLGNIIMEYFGDGSLVSPVTGKTFGVSIDYYIEESPLGNAGALFFLKKELKEDFLLLNADSIFNIDFKRFIHYHKQKEGLATIITHPNSHPYDSGLIIIDNNNAVTEWLSKEDNRPKWYSNRVNAGLHIINPKLLSHKIEAKKIDLDRDILRPLAGTGRLYAYDSSEYIKDMGTPERYEAVCLDCSRGLIKSKKLSIKQKAVFLDRDGTINKYVPFLTNIDEFELLLGVAEAIKLINESGYLAIVVTNQPVIARGELSLSELSQIHMKMETLLGREGAYLDKIFFCPHHPHKGYSGEVEELKILCDCRKPSPGMILAAADEFNIDLSKSWMVGDKEDDILAGKRAGCKTVLLGTENYDQDMTFKTLLEFVKECIICSDE